MNTGNAIIIHGGGLVDPSKEVILRIARGLSEMKVYDKIYLGQYSFMSLYTPSLLWEYDEYTEEFLKDKRGTFLGTCRDIDLTNPDLMQKAIDFMKYKDIKTVIVCGGDGSARQCAEINGELQKNGINIVFAVPLTVDGINGGDFIGLEQAVREAVRQIENVAATSLETRDKGEFSVVAVELQGRNRDDILANVLWHFYNRRKVADCNIDEICLRVVPANYPTDEAKLIEEINSSNKRTLVLVSEGASLKLSDLKDKVERKVRTVVVGHAVQSNGMTTAKDMEKYSMWLADVVCLIKENPDVSFSIVNNGYARKVESIDYYALLNPRKNQQAPLSNALEYVLKLYMANIE